jgi:hypothetical protein
MGDTMLVAIVAGLFGLLGVWLGTLLTEKRYKTDRKDKFALVALDKKLDVHQRAFSLSRKMFFAIHKPEDEKYKVGKEAFEFWEENCLYMSIEVRNEFINAYWSFANYKIYVEAWKSSSNPKEKESNFCKMNKKFEQIKNVQKVIEKTFDFMDIVALDESPDGKIVTATGIEDKKT